MVVAADRRGVPRCCPPAWLDAQDALISHRSGALVVSEAVEAEGSAEVQERTSTGMPNREQERRTRTPNTNRDLNRRERRTGTANGNGNGEEKSAAAPANEAVAARA